MYFYRARPIFRTVNLTASRVYRHQYSTQKPAPQSKSLRAAVISLTIGIPAGFAAHQVWNSVSVDQPGGTFEEGSEKWKSHAVKPFTLKDVDAWLSKEESSSLYPMGSGVRLLSSVRCASNPTCEDNYTAARSPVGNGSGEKPWLFWGVFDGHNGPAMSLTLKETLVPYVSRHLSALYEQGTPSNEAVEKAVNSAFCQLDGEILGDGVAALNDAKSLTEALSRLAPGYAGSCAILSIFDPNSKTLRVACTGDSRAVLGRLDEESGHYVATNLSSDQTGFNEHELARVRAEHPGEKNVIDVKTGRVLGIAVSRAFGDGLWKWPMDVIEQCNSKFFWQKPRPVYKTPPYLTAEPVVTTTQLHGKREFMVIASDGLWDHLSSEQAVNLVEMWLDSEKGGSIGKGSSMFHPTGTVAERGGGEDRTEDAAFIVGDKNVATHLVRNALGGADINKLCGRAGTQAPLSRYVRDDITVQVVFFD